ncbi:MAG: hypothetical protein ACD_79C00986G0001 [uncultured bacterium]|nr:MAG: hypothetical protein ACD_79C00986G0001 [uncultured bacterium]
MLFAINSTLSKSPGEEIGKPASMTSTPSLSSCFAISNFSETFKLAPGHCSPSRKVVSNIINFSIFSPNFFYTSLESIHFIIFLNFLPTTSIWCFLPSSSILLKFFLPVLHSLINSFAKVPF